MAKSRSIPTDLLFDPDYMELDSDTQVILLMLVLTADDEGRGRAHTGMLARHFNKPAERIEQALALLSELDLVMCYVVGRHRYYHLVRWGEWQTLSKPTPSRYPLPPTSPLPESLVSASPRETQGNPGESWVEGEGKRREQNPEEKKAETKEDSLPAGITRFPERARFTENTSHSFRSASSSPAPAKTPPEGDASVQADPPRASGVPVQQVANILRIPVTEPLTHLVTEYTTLGSLALLGEADAAREWIEDITRNRHHKPMSVAFFRRWLKREQEMMAQRHAPTESQTVQMRATGTTGSSGFQGYQRGGQQQGDGYRLPSLMHLAEEDQQAKGVRS